MIFDALRFPSLWSHYVQDHHRNSGLCHIPHLWICLVSTPVDGLEKERQANVAQQAELHAKIAVLNKRQYELDKLIPVKNAELAKGLVVTGTMTQVIGKLNSHGTPAVGDSFQIKLDGMPKEKLTLTPLRVGTTSYIPFSSRPHHLLSSSSKATSPSQLGSVLCHNLVVTCPVSRLLGIHT